METTHKEVRTAEERQDIRDAIYELKGDVCRGCNGKKREMQSFCYGCYRKLSKKVQSDLYKTIHDGYAQVYKEAKEYLANLARLAGVQK